MIFTFEKVVVSLSGLIELIGIQAHSVLAGVRLSKSFTIINIILHLVDYQRMGFCLLLLVRIPLYCVSINKSRLL